MTLVELTSIAADVVNATQRKLPPEIRPLAQNVPVHYQTLPDDDVIAEGFPEDILGLFTGSPHGLELEAPNPELAQIILYLENVWDFAEEDVQAFRDEIRVTYLHELGHYLGWDEDDLTSRGLD
ncbi:MAG TPA: metallopeptidase family protein [Opitutus sp.]|nr:metallopeptidase family protein [Opitutus sp.]